jgi:hypothetical protein
MLHDHEQEYPKHQPGRGEHDHHDPFAPAIQEEGELERGPVHQRSAATTPQLPHGHARKALIIGAILGALVSVQSVVLTLKNADTFKQAASFINDPSKMPAGIATSVLGIVVLGYVISLLIYLVGGLIIGKVAVHRRWAFIGGFVGGLVSAVIGALLNLIPAYPNAGNTGMGSSILGIGGGFVALLIGFALLGLLAGAICLLGAWFTTRRHPYYVGYTG